MGNVHTSDVEPHTYRYIIIFTIWFLGSVSTGGRRISHDPFTLCQDLQVLETRRRSEAFQQRRKSEQFQMSSTGRRKSSVFGPLLEQRDNERKSFSMEQM